MYLVKVLDHQENQQNIIIFQEYLHIDLLESSLNLIKEKFRKNINN